MSKLEKDFKDLCEAYNNKNYYDSIELGEIFTRKFPQKGDGWNVLALAYKSIGKTKRAVKILELLIKQLPQVEYYKANLGNLFLKMGRINDAKTVFSEILKNNSQSEIGLYSMGVIYMQIKKESKGQELFQKLIEINPKHDEAIYQLGNIYKSKGNYQAALQLFKKSNAKHSRSNCLECLICEDQPKKLFEYYQELSDREVSTPLMGGVIEHARIIYNQNYKRSFCNNIFKYIELSTIKESEFSEFDCQEIIKFHQEQKSRYRHQEMLHNGSQSAGNMFNYEHNSIQLLKKCIERKISCYRQKYENSKQNFIKYWPSEFELFGWIVAMQTNGFLTSHNHKEGWLSGSFYLKVPPRLGNEHDGSINFSQRGPLYPRKSKTFEEKTIEVNTRDICLFPSSIFHSTIPFKSKKERIVFVFDILPT